MRVYRFSAGEVSAADDAGSGRRIVRGGSDSRRETSRFLAVDFDAPGSSPRGRGRLRRELLVVASVMPVRCQRRLAPRVTPCQTVSVSATRTLLLEVISV